MNLMKKKLSNKLELVMHIFITIFYFACIWGTAQVMNEHNNSIAWALFTAGIMLLLLKRCFWGITNISECLGRELNER